MEIKFENFLPEQREEIMKASFDIAKLYNIKAINVSFPNDYTVGENELEPGLEKNGKKGWQSEPLIEIRTGWDEEDGLTNSSRFAVTLTEKLGVYQTLLKHNKNMVVILGEEAKQVMKDNAVEAFAEKTFQNYVTPKENLINA